MASTKTYHKVSLSFPAGTTQLNLFDTGKPGKANDKEKEDTGK